MRLRLAFITIGIIFLFLLPAMALAQTDIPGSYALFTHGHDGHYGGYGPLDSSYHRRPILLHRGHYVPGGDQPVRFDDPEPFMDHRGVGLGPPGRPRYDLALYSSLTVRDGTPVLWYPDRKYFLLGRRLA